MSHVVIVGTGHGGIAAAAFLRQYGFDGRITLIGEENAIPYQRPPLSKGWLLDTVQREDIALRPADFYQENGIELKLGQRVLSLDRSLRSLALDAGEKLSYDSLVLATGCCPVGPPIPGVDSEGVLMLRNVRDATRLKKMLGPKTRLVIIGGGYIGLEVAASARQLGGQVTVIERAERVLSRVAHPQLSTFLTRQHERHGVHIEVGRCVTSIDSVRGALREVTLDDGRRIACDAVLVGIGARPNDGLARDAGLACNDGVVVDHEARTSDRNIFAIGDMSRRPLPLYDRTARLESVPSATEQARQAACAITGRSSPPPEVPWQWSNQYDLKIQIAGYPFDADEVVVRAGLSGDSLALFHFRGERLLAVEAVNAPAEFMAGRQLIGRKAGLDKQQLQDLSLTMKQLMEAK